MSYHNEFNRPPEFNHNPYSLPFRKKKKWLACLFSLFIPGTGHFYLGLMQRGLLIMVLIILDIFTVVSFASSDEGTSVPLITLFSLIIPVIYFYSIFDALQSTDMINIRYARGDLEFGENPGDPLQKLLRGNNLGVILIGAGGLFFLLSVKPRWFEGMFEILGSYVGAVLLIAAGFAMFMLESRKK